MSKTKTGVINSDTGGRLVSVAVDAKFWTLLLAAVGALAAAIHVASVVDAVVEMRAGAAVGHTLAALAFALAAWIYVREWRRIRALLAEIEAAR